MKNKILTAIVLLIEIVTGSFWITCQKLSDRFYFSSYDVVLKIDELVHNDVGYATYTVRFFHNKLPLYSIEIINRYLQFWDLRFDVLYFSIVGYFGILYGFWHLLRKENKSYKTWAVLIGLLLLPTIEIFHLILPFAARMVVLFVPYYLFSLFGIWQFLKKHKRLGLFVVIGLILLSIWYTAVFQKEIFRNFCYN
jgi:hypothetical protein